MTMKRALSINREAIGWTRGDYYAANRRRLEAIGAIVADWKELKALRQSQGFATTGGQLVVKKSDSHQLDWQEEIERQMDEARRLHQETRRTALDRYKQKKAQWKAKRRRQRVRRGLPRSQFISRLY